MANGYILITGAGSGLGREVAILQAASGRPLVLVGRSEQKLRETQKLIPKTKTKIAAIDIATKANVDQVFDAANKEFGYPEIVISCAGEGVFGAVGSLSENQVDSVLGASLRGLIFISQRAFLDLKQRGGTIVNVMSTASHTPRANESIYCAAKFGARGFTESLRLEAKGTPVQIMAVYPGGMKTPFWSDHCGMSPDTKSFMDPSEVAQVIVDNLLKRKSLQITDLTINRI